MPTSERTASGAVNAAIRREVRRFESLWMKIWPRVRASTFGRVDFSRTGNGSFLGNPAASKLTR